MCNTMQKNINYAEKHTAQLTCIQLLPSITIMQKTVIMQNVQYRTYSAETVIMQKNIIMQNVQYQTYAVKIIMQKQ